jgi:hypothetical protein
VSEYKSPNCAWVNDLGPNKKGLQVIEIACKPFIFKLEAASGFEPEIAILQTAALPLGYAAPKKNGAGNGI